MKSMMYPLFLTLFLIFSQVVSAQATLLVHYPFSGNTNDASGGGNHAINNGAVLTTDRFGNSNSAYSFNGSSQYMASTQTITNPFPLSISLWFKTTTTSGGKLFGFGSVQTGGSPDYDRHLYMTNDGKLTFGVWNGGPQTVLTPVAYNDGNWHHVAATASEQGLQIYIDAVLVRSFTSALSVAPFNGYWRIGYDELNGWPDIPASTFFAGTLDEVRVYSGVLTAQEVFALFAEDGSDLLVHYPFNGNTDDLSGNGNNAVNNGATLRTDRFNIPDRAYSFDGTSNSMSSFLSVVNPFPLSISLWFKTTTTSGGKLFGFGSDQTGASLNYDRHIYMNNSGQIYWGVWTGGPYHVISPGSYNNEVWHHVVGVASLGGMKLYIDGTEVASITSSVEGQNFTGYWRIGYDDLANWPEVPASNYFNGGIDDIRVFKKVLSSSEVMDLFNETTGTDEPDQNIPASFSLMQNYPNPFNPETQISYTIPRSGRVKLSIYSPLGELIAVLADGYHAAGYYEKSFNAAHLNSGVYFYRMETEGFSAVKKMILLK